jgi:cytochrome c peroxidase
MAFKKSLCALTFALPLVFGLSMKKRNSCDFLKPIVTDLLDNLFENECGDAAHGALRLMFHDAIGIDPVAGGGGADGSILTFNETELAFPANAGLDDVLDDVGPFYLKYQDVLSPGDFVQLAGTLSLSFCPGAPRVLFSLGRPHPVAASPPNLVPEPFDDVTKILARFASVGFTPQQVISLLSSHSVAGADTVDPTIPGTPFDSTPSVFDTQVFIEVLLTGTLFPGTSGNQGEVESAIEGTLRLQSDFLLARDSRTACFWQDLASDHASVQHQFANNLFQLSLLGQNQADLTDCSFVIPFPPSLSDVPSFPPGQTLADIDQSCTTNPFPNLPTEPGPPLDVPPIPQADDGDS